MIGGKKESLQDGNYTSWSFYAILKEHFLIVFEDPIEESKRVGDGAQLMKVSYFSNINTWRKILMASS